jgi:2-polyprenyl-3-methyl-5-hydroxy-6-metoxy-1,4-benzoquinol methylase
MPYRIDPCDLCGSSDYAIAPFTRVRFDDGQSAIGICRNCALAHYLSSLPNESDRVLREDYYGNYYAVDDAGTKESRYKDLAATRLSDLERIVPLQGKTILDVGSGEGQLLDLIRSRGGIPSGIEPQASVIAPQVARGLDVFTGTFEEFAAADHRKFDMIVLYYVLDAMQKPSSALKMMRRMLKDDAHLYIHVGSLLRMPFFYQLRILRKPLAKFLPWRGRHNIHPYYFSRRALIAMLGAAGFDVVSISPPTERWCSVVARASTAVPVRNTDHWFALWWSFALWRLFDLTVRPIHNGIVGLLRPIVRSRRAVS